MTNWRVRAACAAPEVDPELFFAERKRGRPTHRTSEEHTAAKKICATCEVVTECYEYGEASGSGYGTWGGLTDKERAQLRNKIAGRQLRTSRLAS